MNCCTSACTLQSGIRLANAFLQRPPSRPSCLCGGKDRRACAYAFLVETIVIGALHWEATIWKMLTSVECCHSEFSWCSCVPYERTPAAGCLNSTLYRISLSTASRQFSFESIGFCRSGTKLEATTRMNVLSIMHECALA